jgi:hypothetical protein
MSYMYGGSVVPACTKCGEELKVEYHNQDRDAGWSWINGYCDKCMKYLPLCGKEGERNGIRHYYCIRSKDHDGNHKDYYNNTWK